MAKQSASVIPVRMETLVERQRRRARLVLALRLAVLVFLVGGWEFGVDSAPVDRSSSASRAASWKS